MRSSRTQTAAVARAVVVDVAVAAVVVDVDVVVVVVNMSCTRAAAVDGDASHGSACRVSHKSWSTGMTIRLHLLGWYSRKHTRVVRSTFAA